MIGMIVVDDELIIRQGLLSIPWNDFGIEVKGAASNGEEALALIKSTQPEILLTDIRMPGMDGLKLIYAVKSEMPGIKAILLTGYQDFSYAHTAIGLGAFGYVLKPSDPEEIVNIVLKAKKQVEDELAEKYKNEQIIQKINKFKPAVLNSFVQDLLYGRNTDGEDISEKCREFNLTLVNYVVMLIEFERGNELLSGELLGRLKEEICITASGYNKFNALNINHSTYCIINEISISEDFVKDKMLSLAMEIRNNLKSKFNIYVSIGISRCCNSAANMFTAFNQAMNCLRMKFSLGRGAVIHVEELMTSLKRQNVLALKFIDEVIENIKTGNYRKVEELTRELLFRLAKEQKADEQMIKSICFDILMSSLRVLKEEKSIEAKELDEQFFHSILTRCNDVEELEECVLNTLMNIMDSVHSKAPVIRNKVTNDVLDYIERFYMDDISLLTASESVFMNHIYISRLIKKETGETFLDILTRTRMKKACELLANSTLKTYEISDLVGIKDSGYFSQVFKKYNGVTPSEYRETLYLRCKNNKEDDT